MHGCCRPVILQCNMRPRYPGLNEAPMSEDWNTKWNAARSPRRRRWMSDFAAIGITDDPQAQAEIAAALMGLPFDTVLAEVKKQSRVNARRRPGDHGRARRAAFGRGRTRVVRKFASASVPGRRRVRKSQSLRRASRSRHLENSFSTRGENHHARAASSGATFAAGNGPGVGALCCARSMLPVDSPWWKVSFAPNLLASVRIASFWAPVVIRKAR